MRTIFIIALMLRTVFNIQQYSDPLYFLGRDILELVMLLIIYKISEGWVKQVVLICAIQTLINAFKPLVINPRINDMWEVYAFIGGATSTILIHYVKRYYKSYFSNNN